MFSLFFALGFTVPLESFYSAVFCVSIPMAAIMVAFLKWCSKNVVLIQHLKCTCAHCLISLSCLSYLSVIYMELRHAIFIFILKTSLFEIILAVVSKRIWAEFGGRQLFPSMDVLMCLTTICRSDATSRKLFMCFWHLRSSLFIWWAKNTFKRVTMAVCWMWITWWLFFTRTWLQITQSTFKCE